jgi:hypothetical protein
MAVGGVQVGQDGVVLPCRAVGVVGPDLGLPGIAAAGLIFCHRAEASDFHPLPGLVDLFGGLDFDAEVLIVAAGPLPGELRTSLSGGESMAKLAYPGLSLAGSVPNSRR